MIDFTNDVENCLEILCQGGTILYPTDTIWGLGCDATLPESVEKIIDLKQRPANKSFVVLVADERMLMQYVATLDLEVFNFLEKQSKPTTVIYEHGLNLAENVLASNGSVAIRICKDEFCKTLIKRFRKPIVSTSANISNNPSPQFYSEVDDLIKNGVDYVVKYRQNDNEPKQASSIIKWNNGKIEVLR